MKTPREVLFDQHEAIEPRLDSLREAVVANLSAHPPPARTNCPRLRWMSRWIDHLQSVRWQLASLGASWVLIAVLNHESSPSFRPTIAQHHPPSPRQILAALQENRRQLWELIRPPESPRPAVPQADVPGLREQSVNILTTA